MEKEMSIEDKLIYNNNKLVADKIRKTLLNIKIFLEYLKKDGFGSWFKMLKMLKINSVKLR